MLRWFLELISSRSGKRVSEPSEFSASNDTNAGRQSCFNSFQDCERFRDFHELWDHAVRGMLRISNAFAVGKDATVVLRIDWLDRRWCQDQTVTTLSTTFPKRSWNREFTSLILVSRTNRCGIVFTTVRWRVLFSANCGRNIFWQFCYSRLVHVDQVHA